MDKKPGILRATLVGGVLYMIPIVLLVAILGKALQLVRRVQPPVEHGLEAVHLGGILAPELIAVLLLLLFCLAAGLFARTAVAKRFGDFLDTKVLGNIPGYTLYKGIGESLMGAEPAGDVRPVVLVSIEDAWQLAMVVDKLEDGLLAVFVPGVPEARSGSLYFMSPDRVRPLSISAMDAIVTLRRMGVGSRELLKGEGLPPEPTS